MRSRIPSVIFSASAITTGITACASMDFPLAEASNYPDRKLFDVVRIEALFPNKLFKIANPFYEVDVISRNVLIVVLNSFEASLVSFVLDF